MACEKRGQGRSRTKGERSPRRACWVLLQDGPYQSPRPAAEQTSDIEIYQPGLCYRRPRKLRTAGWSAKLPWFLPWWQRVVVEGHGFPGSYLGGNGSWRARSNNCEEKS